MIVAAVTTIILVATSKVSVFVHLNSQTIEYKIATKSQFEEPNDLPLGDGQIIDGWFMDENFTTPFDFSTSINKNINIFAKVRQLEKQTINFHANGIDLSLDSVEKYENTSCTPPDLNSYARNGYSFVGWAYEPTATESDILVDDDFLFVGKTSVDIYAIWHLEEYTISFVDKNYTIKINGVMVDCKDKQITYTILDDITLPEAQKQNAEFLGYTITPLEQNNNWAEDFISKNDLAIGTGHYGNICICMSFKVNDCRLIFEVDNDRKSLFIGTKYEYLVNPQSEDDYIYCGANSPFKSAYKLVDGEKYYVFLSDPTNSQSTYTTPAIAGMGDSVNRCWQALNANGKKQTPIKEAGTTQLNSLMITDKTITFTPIWKSLKINLKLIDPIEEEVISDVNDEILAEYGLEDGSISIEYGTTVTLPVPAMEGWTFVGWFTSLVKGEKFTNEDGSYTWTDTSMTDLDVYMRWR